LASLKKVMKLAQLNKDAPDFYSDFNDVSLWGMTP
jgi:hypothetical protein